MVGMRRGRDLSLKLHVRCIYVPSLFDLSPMSEPLRSRVFSSTSLVNGTEQLQNEMEAGKKSREQMIAELEAG